MDIFSVFSLLGGLAMFLYGMSAMGEGLEKLAGNKLERIFEKLTSNPLKGLALGIGVTAVIQSSSATTVMLVGFVNSGIMRLAQAIPIIMGANIGTTVTSWILSLSGLEGDNFFIRLCKPTSFSPILAFIGIILIMFVKDSKKKDIGRVLLGFAILMFGMDMMGGAVKPLANEPKFTNILLLFNNPILGVLAGAALTAIIQSSSASVGILQALSVTGQLRFGAAVPIILGQNIGTCVTAMISGVGANKNAKRVAVVHLYFNVIGTLIFLILFYTLNAIIRFDFLEDAVNGTYIAIVHTIFNLVTTTLLFPFIKVLEKAAIRTVKDTEVNKKEEFQLLDERLMLTPSIAIEQCRTLTVKMAELARKTMLNALDMTNKYDDDIAKDIIENEDIIDTYEDKIGSYLVKLSTKSLSDIDSKSISKILHLIGDFERISDHAVNILEVAKEIDEKGISFSEEAETEIAVVNKAVTEILNLSVDAFGKNNIELARRVEPLEEVVDSLRMELKNRHIMRLRENKCTIELGFIFSDLLTNLERVSDHCSNIAICIIQSGDDTLDMHEYINQLKSSGEIFDNQCDEYFRKYALPKYHM